LIAADQLTLGTLARQQGYQTVCIGKWHLGWEWPIPPTQKRLFRSGQKSVETTPQHRRAWQATFSQAIPGGPTARGFDHYFGTDVPNWPPYCFIEDERTQGIPETFAEPRLFAKNQASLQGPAVKDWTLEPILPTLGDRAASFLRKAADDPDPFLLYLPLTSPHTPLAVNDNWKGKSNLGLYADFVMETDAVIGQVLQALQESGAADETLVIFTSDNGCAPYIGVERLEEQGHYPSGPLRGYKSDAWEGGHRIPFIVCWPGIVAAESVCPQLVHQADLLATLADLFDVTLPVDAGEDSFSLLPLLRGNDRAVRTHAVSCSIKGTPSFRAGPWKLILASGSGGWTPGGDPEQAVQLYDLAHDLGEAHNVAAQYPERVAAMSGQLAELIDRGRSTPGPQQANDVPVIRHGPMAASPR
jgi:arylsulfatase A-like enzyme